MGTLRTSWPASFRKAKALPPEEVGDLIEALIEIFDATTGDPDMEDSEAGQSEIDERGNLLFDATPFTAHDEDRELSGDEHDRAYAEWISLHSATRRSGGIDGKPTDPWFSAVHEDDEDDDCDSCLTADDRGTERFGRSLKMGFGDATWLDDGAEEEHDGVEMGLSKPKYGIDQSAGPINNGAANREHQISMMRPEEQVRIRAQLERNGR